MPKNKLDKSKLLDKVLSDDTGILTKSCLTIVEAMEEYHQDKVSTISPPTTKHGLLLLGNKWNFVKEFEKSDEYRILTEKLGVDEGVVSVVVRRLFDFLTDDKF